jgi:DNA polymerase III epsilon subunit-like protein
MQDSQAGLHHQLSARVRVIDLETTGSAATDVCEIGWQDVVQEDDGRWVVNGERGAVYVDPGRPISPQTMAIHHITDTDVVGARFWKDAAPPILKPRGGVVALAAHRAAFEQRYCSRGSRVAHAGSAPGNAPSDSGPRCRAFQTRCCAMHACPRDSIAHSACLHTGRYPMPM